MDKNTQDSGASGKYARMESERGSYLTRAREAALLTIPTLMPPASNSAGTKYPTPYQGLGARGVNNLASKLLLALLPPNSPFFRLSIDDYELEALTKQEGMRGKIEEAFGRIERTVMNSIETKAARVKTFEALKQLIVAGNVLMHVQPDGSMRVFRLDRYVVKRDPVGNVLEIIVKEDIAPRVIPIEIRKACGMLEGDKSNVESIALYTHIKRENSTQKFSIHQELNQHVVPKSEGDYPIEECPWLPLRWTSVENEDYGRGFIEEYMGDLKTLEGLSKSIVEGAAAASKIIFLLKQNSTINKRKLIDSPNGAVLDGNVEDVGILQLEKYADYRVAYETAQEVTKRLSYAFMLNSSVQRSGERVTAEEVRYMASELEDALGGVYSILSQEMQLPLVRILLSQLGKDGKLPELPKDLVRPMITTGLEALGRGHDLQKLNTFFQQLQPLGPDALATYMNIPEYIARIGASLGIDTKGLIKTQQQIEQEKQQALMAQMAQNAAPTLAQGAMDSMQQGVPADGNTPQ